ncbi:phosphohexomutase domain-containing protein [Sessilibacter sp. MAH4]
MDNKISCFKAYDIRGQVPGQLNEDVAYRIGRAFAQYLSAKKVVVGHDIRLSSPALTDSLIDGLTDGGADVLHIGVCGTEEVYFASFSRDVDGGICVTASHNPIDYNGMKLVRRGSRPISGDTGLFDIQALAESGDFNQVKKGAVSHLNSRPSYIDHLLTYVDLCKLSSLKIVANPGNGGAGLIVDAIEERLPTVKFVKIQHEPDGQFPNGIPNPLLPENRSSTSCAVIDNQADFGIAWDGDFDRCFFFDENGRFIEGYYLVGLLAEAFLKKSAGSKIVHDPRLTWNTQSIVKQHGGVPVMSKTGHAFIKERMREEDAIYGGEMSAHHYFRDFAYCDSGMIPWLLVAELVSVTGKPLSKLVDECMRAYPCSGEINRVVENSQAVIDRIEAFYSASANHIDYTDGVSIEFDDWRFNLRRSNTEPVIRLNVETRANQALMEEKRDELLALMELA